MKKVWMALALVMGVMIGLDSVVVAQPVWADGICDETPDDMKEAVGCGPTEKVENVAKRLLEAALGVMPIIALAVMIYGGVTYVTSQGDSGKTTKAKNILIYGVVGLIVSMLAYALVVFVLENVIGVTV